MLSYVQGLACAGATVLGSFVVVAAIFAIGIWAAALKGFEQIKLCRLSKSCLEEQTFEKRWR